ncbi:MAG: PEGA domain-containing protein [Prevotella sp.]|nr:PEGA domain-containing protein [Prevotella sp.]
MYNKYYSPQDDIWQHIYKYFFVDQTGFTAYLRYEDGQVKKQGNFNPVVLGNIALGGIPGTLVDLGTGAWWKYKDSNIFYDFTLNSKPVTETETESVDETKTIELNSEPTGAKVVLDGKVVCESTPCTTTVTASPVRGSKLNFKFIKNGYKSGDVTIKSDLNGYPDAVFYEFKERSVIAEDPTIRKGEATNMVTRDKPGGTALERTIIRWNFDSDPRGSRIFWRVISSVPDQVKNTNETYLTTTPYEETRSFNILGLTYENSRDVTIEIKVSRKGYMDQVKRYNARQAIDQQEISGFFDLVKDDSAK